MTPPRAAITYMRDRLIAAGYICVFGMEEPALAHCPPNGDIQCEIWLTDGQVTHHENAQQATDFADTIELFVIRHNNNEDKNGQWYDDLQNVYDALTANSQDRAQAEYIWWDGKVGTQDRNAALKFKDNSTSYSQGWKCGRIDLPINYLRGLSL